MKNVFRIISLLLAFLFCFPTAVFCDSLDELDEIITAYSNEGMTISDIADMVNEVAPSILNSETDNVLLLCCELITRELKLRGIPINHTTDIRELSYNELVALKNQINLAMWECDEWQEVTVPQGVWVVGEDIPAGHWTVKCADGWRCVDVKWGEYLNESGESISWRGRCSMINYVYNPNSPGFDPYKHSTEYSFEVREGEYIVIYEGSCVFTPYAGKPDLGFK